LFLGLLAFLGNDALLRAGGLPLLHYGRMRRARTFSS
jgi:hypothetical protein